MLDFKPHGNPESHSKNWRLSARTISQHCWLAPACQLLACGVATASLPFCDVTPPVRLPCALDRLWPDMLQTTCEDPITRTGDRVLERFRHVATFDLLGQWCCYSLAGVQQSLLQRDAPSLACRRTLTWYVSRCCCQHSSSFNLICQNTCRLELLYSKGYLKLLNQALGIRFTKPSARWQPLFRRCGPAR